MAKSQRDLGAAFEREVANAFIAAGFHAERTGGQQAGFNRMGQADVTVTLNPYRFDQNDYIVRVECKRDKGNLPDYLWKPDPFNSFGRPKPSKFLLDALEGNDVVVFWKPSPPGKPRLPIMAFWMVPCSMVGAKTWPVPHVATLAEYMEGLK